VTLLFGTERADCKFAAYKGERIKDETEGADDLWDWVVIALIWGAATLRSMDLGSGARRLGFKRGAILVAGEPVEARDSGDDHSGDDHSGDDHRILRSDFDGGC
jgi:hypothetical protein